MNYAAEVLAARQERDATLERARSIARSVIAAAAAARDREIEALKAADPTISTNELAMRVGCSRSQVFEVLNPERRARYNRRRAAYWRGRHLKAVG